MVNLSILNYWEKIFDLTRKTEVKEYELVRAMLTYHGKEPTAENQTRCLGKIFRDTYRGYLVFVNDGTRKYRINKQKEVE